MKLVKAGKPFAGLSTGEVIEPVLDNSEELEYDVHFDTAEKLAKVAASDCGLKLAELELEVFAS